MNAMVVFDIAVILGLILANGFFSGSELAIIAARRSRLTQLAEEGSRGARIALELAKNPNRFLPTVQIGITLVGTLAAAFGGARFEDYLSTWLAANLPHWLAKHAHGIALAVVVVGITYLSVLFGELVPKRLALQRAAEIAPVVAIPMDLLARLGRPVVWFMGVCTEALLKLFGARVGPEPDVSLEDIEHALHSGRQSGLLEAAEQQVALGALTLGDRTARDIMRPRVDLDALDVHTPDDEVLGAVAMSGMTRLPIYDGHVDHIIGFVNIKGLRRHYLGLKIELRRMLHPVMFVPETLTLDRLLVMFQQRGSHLAIVLDEFGGTEGLVTLQDVLEAVVGRIGDEHQRDSDNRVVRRDEVSWLIDGTVSFDDFLDIIEMKLEEEEDEPRNFSTLAGLVLSELGRIPRVGESLVWHDVQFEVVDMDGNRVDRLLVTKLPPAKEAGKLGS